MAYFTVSMDQRALTESETTQALSYVNAQKDAGTTDGQRYGWTVYGKDTYQSTRMWGTTESANGYKDLFASFDPPISVSVY